MRSFQAKRVSSGYKQGVCSKSEYERKEHLNKSSARKIGDRSLEAMSIVKLSG